jgi:hypothetical protein
VAAMIARKNKDRVLCIALFFEHLAQTTHGGVDEPFCRSLRFRPTTGR